MGSDLELIRAFRAEDGMVDASSLAKARATLLEHIDGSATGMARARRRWPVGKLLVVRLHAEIVAFALATLVVVGVGAAFLSIGSKRPQRPARHSVVKPQVPRVIQNFSPRKAPALPGRTACTAELTPLGSPPGGLFYLSTCQFKAPGIGGSPHGMFHASSGVNGVNKYRFLITASGLRPNTDGDVYAVWLLQAAPRGGTVGSYRLLKPEKPRLLGVIEPGVGRDGKLAAEGSLPLSLLGSDYLLLITLQPHPSVATPGRTVLHGFVSPSTPGA